MTVPHTRFGSRLNLRGQIDKNEQILYKSSRKMMRLNTTTSDNKFESSGLKTNNSDQRLAGVYKKNTAMDVFLNTEPTNYKIKKQLQGKASISKENNHNSSFDIAMMPKSIRQKTLQNWHHVSHKKIKKTSLIYSLENYNPE